MIGGMTLPAGAQELGSAELKCRECHAVPGLSRTDPRTGREITLTIDLDAYARSVHGSVRCYACHERGYDALPHSGPLRYPRFLCVDCHRDTESLAQLQFERRRDDLLASAHGKRAKQPFDCHDCHDPHRFELVRTQETALDRIRASNEICLRCHGPAGMRNAAFAKLANVLDEHTQLPHKRNHFRKVKCVSCHTPAESTTRHDIMGKDDMTLDCTRCHSRDSAVLEATYAQPEDRDTAARGARGTPSSADGLRGNAYVVGSSRSRVLDWLSIVGFLLVTLLVAAHAGARMLRSRKR